MRRKTVNVQVGDMMIGSDYPIRTQSMTTVSTLDTDASVDQAIRIINAGTAILLNLLPTLIINCSLSSTDIDIFFKIGAKTAPMNNEPPTQIAALVI